MRNSLQYGKLPNYLPIAASVFVYAGIKFSVLCSAARPMSGLIGEPLGTIAAIFLLATPYELVSIYTVFMKIVLELS